MTPTTLIQTKRAKLITQVKEDLIDYELACEYHEGKPSSVRLTELVLDLEARVTLLEQHIQTTENIHEH